MHEFIEQIINSQDRGLVQKLFEDYYNVDIAQALEEIDDEDVLKKFIALTNNEQLSHIIEESAEDLQSEIIQNISVERATSIFQLMPNDEVVDILGNLPVGLRKQYLDMMKHANRADVQTMLAYDPQSAGGLMTTEFITLSEELTVSQAFAKLREISPNTEVIDTLFIRGKNHRLVGWIDIRDLFLNDATSKLQEFMNAQVISVTPDTDQEEVANLSSKYDLTVIPVVNKKDILLGIITVDDIIDVIHEEFQEDMLRLGGVQESEEIGGPFVESVKKRLPWLLINLLTAFLASATVALFDDTISKVVALAAISPIITGMGGNSASQTLALVIQGITTGKLDLKEDKHYVFNEIILALANGFATGLVAAGVMYVSYQNFFLSVIVVLSMMANLAVGAIFGYFVPLIIKALHQDPALASTIFITTATDVLGYFVFLGLAEIFLPLIL